jgi:hypothetical protein
LILLLLGLVVAAVLFAISGGHVIFLPLFFILPLGFFGLGRGRATRRRRHDL